MADIISINKPAYSSSYVMPFSASRAVDGNTHPLNRWLCGTVPCWLSIDLGTPTWVGRWAVYQMGFNWGDYSYNLTSFTLQGSNDNTNWTNIDSVSGDTASPTVRTISPVQYRLFRLYVNGGLAINPNIAGVEEFVLYSADPTNPYLSNIELSEGILTPTFSSGTQSYMSAVSPDIDSITLTPTAVDPNAQIKVNGQVVASGSASQEIVLNDGINTITVEVTPVVGQSVTYLVHVEKEPGIYLSNLVPSVGTLTPAFASETFGYTQSVDYSVETIKFTPTAQNSNAQIMVNGAVVASGTESQAISLDVGDNKIAVMILEGGVILSMYTVDVTRSSSPYLTQILISGYLGPAVQIDPTPGNYDYTGNVPANASSVKIKPTAEDTNAVIKVNNEVVASGNLSQAIPISAGDNAVTITVTSATGGQTVQYNLTVHK